MGWPLRRFECLVSADIRQEDSAKPIGSLPAISSWPPRLAGFIPTAFPLAVTEKSWSMSHADDGLAPSLRDASCPRSASAGGTRG